MIKIVKFITTGSVVTVLGHGLYIYFLQQGLHFQLALALDYGFGIILGYLLNKYWTFTTWVV